MRKVFVLFAIMSCVALCAATPAAASGVHQRLSHVVVPAYCNMPRQHLHHGTTQKKYLPRQGEIDYYLVQPISVRLKHHGRQLLAQYGCGAGGVGWPEVLVLYSKHNKLVGSLRLDHYAQAEHSQVNRWRAKGHTVKLWWEDYEGAGFHIHHHVSVLRMRHGHLRLG